MRLNEFITYTRQPLTEGMMSWSEWRKDKYLDPFTDAVMSGEEQSITFIKDGEEFEGVVQGTSANRETARQFKTLLSQNANTRLLAQLNLTVDVLDDENNVIETVPVNLQEIVKDDKVTGQLAINLGNIAELVLGCAVTAKYEKQKGEVEYNDVISVAVRLSQGNGVVSSHAGKDSISFKASVPSADRKAFAAFVGEDPKGRSPADFGIKPTTIKGIETHINSAVKYVNESPRVLLAVDKAAADPGKNKVDVISDGGNAEQQKTTKVDLKIAIDGTQINLLSIKAGAVGQFGQVSGYEFEKLNNFFYESVGLYLSPRTKKQFLELDTKAKGKDRTANRAHTRDMNFHNGFTAAYDEMETLLRRLAKGDQLDLLERVYNGLLHHATRKEEGVEMVILTPNAKKAFSELTFGPELRAALDDYNLTVTRGSSEKMHLLLVHGIPKTTKAKNAMGTGKELLVQYRSYQQKNAVRNIIEMGNLLKELADWEKIEARKTTQQPIALPATAPVEAEPLAQQPIEPQTGMPSGMQSIQPAGSPVTTDDTVSQPDELDVIRKNAGIQVE